MCDSFKWVTSRSQERMKNESRLWNNCIVDCMLPIALNWIVNWRLNLIILNVLWFYQASLSHTWRFFLDHKKMICCIEKMTAWNGACVLLQDLKLYPLRIFLNWCSYLFESLMHFHRWFSELDHGQQAMLLPAGQMFKNR